MTEKKKKSIILVGAILAVLVAGIVLATLFALGVFKDKIASVENEYDPHYESFYDGENDPGVTIDGKLDEDIWQGKNWFKDTYLSQPGAKMPKWNITTHMSEYGIYVGAKIEDENIMNDNQHTMEANTALELYYFIANKGEEVEGGGMNRGYVVVDMRGDVHSTTGKFKRAVIVDGELNSGNTKGATMEIFFPWEFFGKIDIKKGIPEQIYFYPIYCAVFEGKETITTSISSMDSVVKAQLYIYKDYWRFNKDGYMTADRENPVVGDSLTGLAKTGNWDISREKDGVVRSSNGSREHYMYFSKEYTSDFIAETTLVPVKQNNGEAKAGLYFLTGDGQYHLVTLNTPDSLLVNSVNGTKNISKYVMSTYDNKTNVYDYHEDCQGQNPNAKKKEGVQLTVVKNGGKFWYFVDGKFMTSEVKDFMNADVIPAFYAWYADVEFKDYSVKKVNAEETKKYLNEHGVYSVDAKVKGTGGKVEASQIAVAKGQKYDITITSNSGYEVSSILINGQERLADAKRKAKGGVYTITADANNQEIEVKFQKCTGYKLSGFLKGGSKAIPGTLTITSSSNGILRYVVTANENKGYQVVMPAGSYAILAEAEDYIRSTVKVSLNKATTKDITLKASMFASKVTVDGKQVRSNTEVWDRTQEAAGKIYGSYNMGTSLQPLYFAKTGNTAWFSSTIRYSTKFVEGGSYQSDLLGGLWVSDGARTGWFGVRQHGIVYNSQWIEHVIGYDVLSTWNKEHLTTNVDFILIDGEFHVYVDDIYATKVSVTKVVPGAKKDAKLAMGLVMHADKMADIEFSNIKFRTDATQIRKDFAAKQAKHTIPSGTIFSQTVKVNNKTVESKPYRWDLTEIKKNTVTCNDGINNQALMFAKTGKNALIQMTITRTDDFKGKTGYETQPLAGIYVTDGSKTGFFGVRASAIVTNDKWDHIIGRDIMASWANIMSAELEVALKDNEFHIYIDGIFVKKVKVSEVLPGVKAGTTLALGLVSDASGKTASVKFSDIKYTTDAAKVTEYLDSKDPSKAIPEGTLFAGVVTVNGKKVESVVPIWDITDIKNNVVIGNNGGPTNPLMFAKTGTTALVETTVTRLDDKNVSGRESQPMAGIYVTDGTKVGYIGVRASAVVMNGNWDHIIGRDLFATWSTITTADVDFVLKNNQIQLYVDGIFVKAVKTSDVVPGVANDTTLAIGLLMDSSGKIAQMKFADVKFTTDATEVDQYIEDAAGESAIPKDSIFASKVQVNGNEVKSIVPIWDLTNIASNIVVGNNGGATQPLYFKATGTTALVETTVTRLDDASVSGRESQPLAGIYVTDGTKAGYIGVRASAVVINNNWDHIIGRDLFATWSSIKTADIDFVIKANEVYIYVDDVLMKKVKTSDVVPGIANDATVAVGLLMDASGKNAQMKFGNVKYTTDASKVDSYLNPPAQVNDPMFTDKVTVNGKEALSGLDNWVFDGATKKATGTHTTNSVFYMAPLYFKQTGTSMLFQATVKNVSNPIKDQPLAGLYITDGTNKGGFGLFSNLIKYGQWLDKDAATLPYAVFTPWDTHPSVKLEVALKDGQFHIYLDEVFVTKLAVNSVMFSGTSTGDLAFGLTMRSEKGVSTSIEFSDINFTTDANAVDRFLNPPVEDPMFAETLTVNGKEVTSNTTDWVYDGTAKKATGTHTVNNVFYMAPLYFKQTGTTMLLQTTITNISNPIKDQPLAGLYITDGTNKGGFGLFSDTIKYGQWLDKQAATLPYGVLSQWVTNTSVKFEVALKNGEFHIYLDDLFVTKLAVNSVMFSGTSSGDLAFGLTMRSEKAAPTSLEFSNINFTTDAAAVDAFLAPPAPVEDPMFAEALTVNGKEVTSNTTDWVYDGANKIATGTHTVTNVFAMAPLYFKETGSTMLLQTTITNDSATIKSEPMAGVYVTDGTNKGHFGLCGNGLVYGPWNEWVSNRHAYAVLSQWGNKTVQFDVAYKDGNFALYVDQLFFMNLPVSTVLPNTAASAELAFGLTMRSANAEFPCVMKFGNINFTTDAAEVDAFLAPPAPVGEPIFAESLTVNSKEVTSNTTDWVYDEANKIATGTHTVTNVFAMAPLYFKETGSTMLLQTTITNDSATIKSEPMAGVYVTDGTNKGHFGLCGNGLVYGPWNEWVSERHSYAVLSQWGNKSVKLDVAYKDGIFAIYVDDVFYMNLSIGTVLPNATASTELAFGLTMRSANAEFPCVMKFSNINFTTDVAKVEEFLDEKNYDSSMDYDPSIEPFIEYARALGQGYENGVGSNKITVDENTTIFIGDSFFDRRYFWTDFYTDDYKDANAFCAGIGSTTTANWAHLIKEVFAVCGDKAPKNIVIHLGTNDLWSATTTADNVVGGLKNVFEILHTKYPQTNIYYFGITHRGDNTAADRINAINSSISTYSQSQNYLTYIDTPSKITAGMLRDDRLHPKLETYDIFVEELAKAGCVVFDKNGQPIPAPEDSMFAENLTVNGKGVTSNTADWVYDGANKTAIGTHTTNSVFYMAPLYFKQTGTTMLLQTTITNISNPIKDQPLAGLYITDGTNKGGFGVYSNLIKYGQWLDKNGPSLGYAVLTQWDTNSSIKFEVALKNGELYIYVNQVYVTKLAVNDVMFSGTSSGDLAFGLTMRSEKGIATSLKFSDINFTTDAAAVDAFLAPPVKEIFAESLTVNGKDVTSNTTDWVYSDEDKKATGTHTTNSVFYMAPMYFKETGTSMLLQTTITNVSNPIKDQPLAGLYITDGTNKGGFGLYSNLVKYGQWLHQDAATLGYAVLTQWDTNKTVQFDVALKNGEFYIYLNGVYVTKLAVNSVMFSGTSSGDLAFGLTMRSEKGAATSLEFGDINFTTDATAVDAFLTSKQ